MRFLVRGVVALIVLLVAAFAAFAVYIDLPAQVTAFTSMTAKLMCSAVFVAGRDEKAVWEQDYVRLSMPGSSMGLARLKVDYEEKSVTSSLAGFGSGKAIFRNGIGCTAIVGRSEAEVRGQGEGVASTLAPPDSKVPWPEGDVPVKMLAWPGAVSVGT